MGVPPGWFQPIKTVGLRGAGWYRFLLLFVQAKRVSISKTDKVIMTDRGGFLGIYSADNIDAIRGEWFHLVVNDECGFIAEDSVDDALTQPSPMLTAR